MAQAVAARPDTQDMVIVHRLFRRELGLAPRIVRAVLPGDARRAETVAAHISEVCTLLHHHHTGEDELVWPKLAERAELAEELLARMEAQHGVVEELLHELGVLLPAWRAEASADVRDRLAELLDELSASLSAHLDEEEREVLPLCAQHMTAQEWGQIGERGMAGVPKSRLLVILGHLLEGTSPQERASFLSHVPGPARLAYRVVGRRSYEKEVAELRRGIMVPQQRKG